MAINTDKLDKIVADAHRTKAERDKSYRERALKLYPWICGRCSREFDLNNLRELTVHHKDHDHFNNPSDGSNWELLCVYCHDHEHQIHADAIAAAEAGHILEEKKHKEATHNPFAGLKDMLEKREIEGLTQLITGSKKAEHRGFFVQVDFDRYIFSP